MQELAPSYKMIASLYYGESMPIKEIARIVKLPQGTVKSRLYKIRGCSEKDWRIEKMEEKKQEKLFNVALRGNVRTPESWAERTRALAAQNRTHTSKKMCRQAADCFAPNIGAGCPSWRVRRV